MFIRLTAEIRLLIYYIKIAMNAVLLFDNVIV